VNMSPMTLEETKISASQGKRPSTDLYQQAKQVREVSLTLSKMFLRKL